MRTEQELTDMLNEIREEMRKSISRQHYLICREKILLINWILSNEPSKE